MLPKQLPYCAYIELSLKSKAHVKNIYKLSINISNSQIPL